MILRRIFKEVFQTVERFLTFLYLIENNQCLSGDDGDLSIKRKFFEDSLGRLRYLEHRFQFRLSVKIEFGAILKALMTKSLHRSSLACLAPLSKIGFRPGSSFHALKALIMSLSMFISTLLSAEKCSRLHFSAVISAKLNIYQHIEKSSLAFPVTILFHNTYPFVRYTPYLSSFSFIPHSLISLVLLANGFQHSKKITLQQHIKEQMQKKKSLLLVSSGSRLICLSLLTMHPIYGYISYHFGYILHPFEGCQ